MSQAALVDEGEGKEEKRTYLEQDAVRDAVDATPHGPAHFLKELDREVDVAAAHAGLEHGVHHDDVDPPSSSRARAPLGRLHLRHDLRGASATRAAEPLNEKGKPPPI